MKIFALVLIIGLLAICTLVYLERRKIRFWREQLPDNARQGIIKRRIELLEDIPADIWQDMQPLIALFQNQVNWEACGGLKKVTQEMKDVISAQACLLIVRSGQELYPRLQSVLIYPAGYRARGRDGEKDSHRLGESWDSGSVVLSWRDVLSGARDGDDAFNLVIHEFAHQLDQINDHAAGVPLLASRDDYREWAAVFSAAYEDYCEKVDRGAKVKIDDYAATNEAEFFAVLSETFFERPHLLRKEYPEVFAELVDYYGMNPAEWRG